MKFTNEFITIYFPNWFLISAGFLTALVITLISIPPIVSMAQLKGFYAMPNGRTSHKNATPYLGGVAVFNGLILSVVLIGGIGFGLDLTYLIAGLIIMLFVGLKDDILSINPTKKLLGQLIACGIVVILGDMRIDHFHGILGITMIPYVASVAFTLFVFIVIINGLNLIDGIDGLASGIGILITSSLGIWFWMADVIPYSILSFSLAGSLAAFFYFNVFSRKNKIFLGDAGSLIVGLVIAVLTIQFLEHQTYAVKGAVIHSAPAVAFGILIVPLFDTLRVFSLRISQGRSPFSADRQHIHHVLLDLGHSHFKSTLIILFANVIFIFVSIGLQRIGFYYLMSLLLILATSMSYFTVLLLRRKREKEFYKSQKFSREVELYSSTSPEEMVENNKISEKRKKMHFLKILNV